MKWAAILVLYGWMAIMLAGCWSKVEINDRSFITAAYVDVSDQAGNIDLTIGTPLPNRLGTAGISEGGGKMGKPYAAITKSAPTLPEALEKAQDDMTRRLTWGQTRAIVIGRAYAEQGLDDLLEWASRQPFFPLRTYIFIAPGKAKDIGYLTPVFEQAPSEVLREFANRHTVLPVTVKDVVVAESHRMGVAIPLLSFNKTPMVSENGQNSFWAGQQGAAMFRDAKMVGTLDIDEAKAISWALKRLDEPTYAIHLEGGTYIVNYDQLDSQIKTSVRGEEITFRIKLSAEAGFEAVSSKLDILSPATIQLLEDKMNAQIESTLKDALMKSQQVQADILQLGSELDWNYPRKWKKVQRNWPQIYKENVRFDIDADIRFVRYDGENKPFWSPK